MMAATMPVRSSMRHMSEDPQSPHFKAFGLGGGRKTFPGFIVPGVRAKYYFSSRKFPATMASIPDE